MATVLKSLGIKRALVVHGRRYTLDEISITGKTKVREFKDEGMKNHLIKPEEQGDISLFRTLRPPL
jgi:anthranilate phosphoribosyltransferase